MKKVIISGKAFFLLTVCFLTFSCAKSDKKIKNELENIEGIEKVFTIDVYQNVRVLTIDTCEYIAITGTSNGGASIIHKQNCKFCAKRNGTEKNSINK